MAYRVYLSEIPPSGGGVGWLGWYVPAQPGTLVARVWRVDTEHGSELAAIGWKTLPDGVWEWVRAADYVDRPALGEWIERERARQLDWELWPSRKEPAEPTPGG